MATHKLILIRSHHENSWVIWYSQFGAKARGSSDKLNTDVVGRSPWDQVISLIIYLYWYSKSFSSEGLYFVKRILKIMKKWYCSHWYRRCLSHCLFELKSCSLPLHHAKKTILFFVYESFLRWSQSFEQFLHYGFAKVSNAINGLLIETHLQMYFLWQCDYDGLCLNGRLSGIPDLFFFSRQS